MEFDQIIKLSTYLEGSKLKKIHLKRGDFELSIEKENEHPAAVALPSSHATRTAITAESLEPIFHPEHKNEKGTKNSRLSEAPVSGKFVVSPMVGTFYAAPSPDQPTFVKVGDRVEESTVVCIIEAMKVMNEVKANVSGTVTEVLVDSAHPVEFGTKIFRIE